MREVRTGQIYRHFKGGLYQIVAVAAHSETNERYVVYQALYGDMDVWVRPYDMFIGEVDHMKYPDVQQKYRFELMNTLLNATGNGDMWNSTHPVTDANAADMDDDRHDTSQYAEDGRRDIEQYVGAGEQTGESVSDGQGTQIESRSADGVDTRLLDFLDAPTYQDKINYLNLIRNNIDDDLINNIAAAMDITINDGPLDTRFFSLRSCLMTKAKYECTRR
jgi:hypothetical protein